MYRPLVFSTTINFISDSSYRERINQYSVQWYKSYNFSQNHFTKSFSRVVELSRFFLLFFLRRTPSVVCHEKKKKLCKDITKSYLCNSSIFLFFVFPSVLSTLDNGVTFVDSLSPSSVKRREYRRG